MFVCIGTKRLSLTLQLKIFYKVKQDKNTTKNMMIQLRCHFFIITPHEKKRQNQP